jgi:phytoene dehydrogenase-like protein
MTAFVPYVPYKLKRGTWDENRELLGDRVVRKLGVCARCAKSILARQIPRRSISNALTVDRREIFSRRLITRSAFLRRPVPGWSQYRTPVNGLYLCGAGAHPGGGVTGAPGYNAAHQALRDLKRGRVKKAVA